MRKSWRLCVVWMFLGICAGIAFTLVSPTYYTAFATILLEHDNLQSLADLTRGVGSSDPAYADSQVQVLQSDEVLGGSSIKIDLLRTRSLEGSRAALLAACRLS